MKAPKLSDLDIEKAVKLLDGWQGKLTWEMFLKVLSGDLGHKYTKMAMHKHPKIIRAWDAAKTRLQSDGYVHGNVVLEQAKKRIQELEAMLETQKRENNLLLEQFLIWAYNAKGRGLTPEDLNRPLPPLQNN
jgi:hypothetical protein